MLPNPHRTQLSHNLVVAIARLAGQGHSAKYIAIMIRMDADIVAKVLQDPSAYQDVGDAAAVLGDAKIYRRCTLCGGPLPCPSCSSYIRRRDGLVGCEPVKVVGSNGNSRVVYDEDE